MREGKILKLESKPFTALVHSVGLPFFAAPAEPKTLRRLVSKTSPYTN